MASDTHTRHASLVESYHLLAYDTLDSTNDEARRLAGGGASHGAVVWARRQTAGRGRMGREWVSAEGNLFATILLSPSRPALEHAQISFVAAVAAAEALESIIAEPQDIRCKWPNDLLFQGRKLGGILLESFTAQPGAAAGTVPWVMVGIGINVDSAPEHVLFPATCLRAAGVEIISAKIVLSRLMPHFITWYDCWEREGFAPIKEAWLRRAYMLGKPVELIQGDERISGEFTGIDQGGQIVLTPPGGTACAYAAGDVFLRKEMASAQ